MMVCKKHHYKLALIPPTPYNIASPHSHTEVKKVKNHFIHHRMPLVTPFQLLAFHKNNNVCPLYDGLLNSHHKLALMGVSGCRCPSLMSVLGMGMGMGTDFGFSYGGHGIAEDLAEWCGWMGPLRQGCWVGALVGSLGSSLRKRRPPTQRGCVLCGFGQIGGVTVVPEYHGAGV
jgi:hypothetical protein